MKKMKVLITFLFLWTTTMMYCVNWRCCLLPWLKQTVKKNNKELQRRLDSGDIELVVLPTAVRTALALPVVPERSKTPIIPRNNSDLDIIVSAENFPNDEQELSRDGTPWQKAASVSQPSKFAPFAGLEVSRTPPLPQAETQQANLDSLGILRVPSNSPVDNEGVDRNLGASGWEMLKVGSDESLGEAVLNSKTRFRHLSSVSSDESVEPLVVSLSKSDNGVQTENNRVKFV
jgi:hypothetical protein